MDTRYKIIDLARAAQIWGEHPSLTIVTGYFDVLTAQHARDLKAIKENSANAPLMVALSTPDEPVLSTRARAEMVAALAIVDWVVTADSGNLQGFLQAAAKNGVLHLERKQYRAMQKLIQHVHQRQSEQQ